MTATSSRVAAPREKEGGLTSREQISDLRQLCPPNAPLEKARIFLSCFGFKKNAGTPPLPPPPPRSTALDAFLHREPQQRVPTQPPHECVRVSAHGGAVPQRLPTECPRPGEKGARPGRSQDAGSWAMCVERGRTTAFLRANDWCPRAGVASVSLLWPPKS